MARLSAQRYLDYMAHAIGDIPLDARHQLLDGLNMCGRELYLAHSWSWRDSGYATLTAVAGQDYLRLPSNWGLLISAHIDNSQNNGFQRVRQSSVEEIMALREAGKPIIGGLWFLAFQRWLPPTDIDEEPLPLADIYPTPSVDGTPTVSARYRKTWNEINAEDDLANLVPDIPAEGEKALLLLCRAFAKNIEDGSQAVENALMEPTVRLLIAEDGKRQMRFGRVRGGAADRPLKAPIENRFTSIINSLPPNNP